jgi:ATP-dependent RNA helicase CshB
MEKRLPFASFAIPSSLLTALTGLGYTHASLVQESTLPRALRGESLMVRYQTGSGKTHAFLIPLFAKVTAEAGLQAIIVSPTRELANQTFQFAKTLNDALGSLLKITVLTGGFDKLHDQDRLASLPNILCVTPGRFQEIQTFISKENLAKVKTIVLDEADMLMDESFLDSTTALLGFIHHPQLLVFSASMATSLLNRLAKYFRPDSIIEPKDKAINPRQVRHQLIDIKHQDPIQAILDFIQVVKPYFLMVFASKVVRVKQIAEALKNRGLEVALLHGELQARERRHLLKRIHEGEFAIVVASDIASRGMDLPNVSDVLSIDLPSDLDYYFHRAGRAGRFDKAGTSSVFYNSHEEDSLQRLKQRGIHFELVALKHGELAAVKYLTRGKLFKKEDEALSRDIKKAIQKYASHEVKPGYKKKVKLAVEKVKSQYKRKAIKKKIRQRLFGG